MSTRRSNPERSPAARREIRGALNEWVIWWSREENAPTEEVWYMGTKARGLDIKKWVISWSREENATTEEVWYIGTKASGLNRKEQGSLSWVGPLDLRTRVRWPIAKAV
jgi:hypothetical protein